MGTVGMGWLVVRMESVEVWVQGVAGMRSVWGMCVVRMAAVEGLVRRAISLTSV